MTTSSTRGSFASHRHPDGDAQLDSGVAEEAGNAEVELYRNVDGSVELVRFDGETVWLTQQQMAELFGRDVRTINDPVKNAESEELAGEATNRNFRIVRTEGAR